MILTATGHRPNKLPNGYSEKTFGRLVDLAAAEIQDLKPEAIISGMALGWDQAVAMAAIRERVPFDAAIPFRGQERVWPVESKKQYTRLLSAARNITVVCEGDYASDKMQRRNEWMVDHADLVLALWDGSRGGTRNCLLYANSVGKPVRNCWKRWVAHCGLYPVRV
jgi:uncharacterized phage-like protein YoqJ